MLSDKQLDMLECYERQSMQKNGIVLIGPIKPSVTDTLPKLIPNLMEKKRYIVHYRNLKLYLTLWMEIKSFIVSSQRVYWLCFLYVRWWSRRYCYYEWFVVENWKVVHNKSCDNLQMRFVNIFSVWTVFCSYTPPACRKQDVHRYRLCHWPVKRREKYKNR